MITYAKHLKDQLDAHVQRIADESFNHGVKLGQDVVERIIIWLDPVQTNIDWQDYTKTVRGWAEKELERLKSKKQ